MERREPARGRAAARPGEGARPWLSCFASRAFARPMPPGGAPWRAKRAAAAPRRVAARRARQDARACRRERQRQVDARAMHPRPDGARQRRRSASTAPRFSALADDALADFRRRVQPVFQDPYGSLDPRWPVGRSVRESLDCFGIGTPVRPRPPRPRPLRPRRPQSRARRAACRRICPAASASASALPRRSPASRS